MGKARAILFDASDHFVADDGWAIASHIALSTLTSLFPFLIFVTALAGFLGTQSLADEATHLIFAAWPAVVAGPIAGEVHNVLTAPRGGLHDVRRGARALFLVSAIEALRTGLNRAYASPEPRPWWRLRLQSLAFALLASAALLALAFLVVLGPLIWAAVLRFAPALAPLQVVVTFARLGVATLLLAITLFIAHRWLPAKRLRFVDIAPGVVATFVSSHRLRRNLRRLLERIRAQLRLDLRGAGFGDDRAGVPLRDGGAVRVRRRAQRGDHARAPTPRLRTPARPAGRIPAAKIVAARGRVRRASAPRSGRASA